MNNLFSIFDPSTNILNIQMNWLSSISLFLFLPMNYWLFPNRYMMFIEKITKKIHLELNNLMGLYYFKGSSLIFISLMFYIMLNNFLGLFPYIFTSTSHLNLSLMISLTMWISFMMIGWINNTNNMFIHLIPQGTPFILMPFMVLIETISNLIRPFTLAIRLTANMIAGHLLITLLSNSYKIMNKTLILMLIMIQIILLILEMAVSIIQSYVITILSTLYFSEIN